jgi:thiamine-phosphate pyrophosphorylase
LQAEAEGADYIGIGPVFATPTKETYLPIGLETVSAVVARVSIPCVAIGGLIRQHIPELRARGVVNMAMVREYQGDTTAVVDLVNTQLAPSVPVS